jgi:hypothetical protein
MAAPVKYRSNGVKPAATVAEAGVYDLTEEAYHADPVPGGSLSSTGARKLLPPSCPALFKWERDNPPGPKRTFDIGHAAHKLVLGAGAPLAVIDAADYKTKAAREERDAAYADGATPLLQHEYEQVQAMAAGLRAHPMARTLFDPERGTPEQSMFWVDSESDVWCRARLDWQPHPRNGRLICPDYKTAASANPLHLQRAVHNFAYYIQAAWYLNGLATLGIADDAAFVFVAQEKEPPYLVTVFEVDDEALALGRKQARDALRTYAECTATDRWPGYSDDVELISLPPYVIRQHELEHTP